MDWRIKANCTFHLMLKWVETKNPIGASNGSRPAQGKLSRGCPIRSWCQGLQNWFFFQVHQMGPGTRRAKPFGNQVRIRIQVFGSSPPQIETSHKHHTKQGIASLSLASLLQTGCLFLFASTHSLAKYPALSQTTNE